MAFFAFASSCTQLVSFRDSTSSPISKLDKTQHGRLSRQRRYDDRTQTSTSITMREKPSDESSPVPIICYGELLYDLMSKTPDAPMSDLSCWTPYAGGAPANVAGCLRALGTPVALASPVGDDDAGYALREHFERLGVNTEYIQHVSDTRTRKIFVRRSLDGERKFVGFDGDNTSFSDTKYLPLGRDELREKFVVSGTMGAAFPGSEKTLIDILQLSNNDNHSNVKVVLDINWREQVWGMNELWLDQDARRKILDIVTNHNIHVIKASTEDVQFLFGDDIARHALSNPSMIREQLNMDGTNGIIITDGENGASCAFGGAPVTNENNVAVAKTNAFIPSGGVVDTTGAGDAFIAGFLSEWVNKGGHDDIVSDEDTLQSMMQFAARVAGVVVSGDGAIAPLESRSQVEEMEGLFA